MIGRLASVAARILSGFRKNRIKPYLKRKNVEGVEFDFWIGDSIGRDWYDLQCTDPVWLEMRFIRDRMVEKGDVVFDCGAHHGCTAILFSNWVGPEGKVIAFEALPANCDILEKNLVQNGLKNVVLERKAVGAVNGTIIVDSLPNSAISLSRRGTEAVVTRIDEYERLHPTFLKIDVEGYEQKVLQGAGKIFSTCPKFEIEIHTEILPKYGASVEEIFRLIGVGRYDLWIQWEDGKSPEPYDVKTPIRHRVHLFGLPRVPH